MCIRDRAKSKFYHVLKTQYEPTLFSLKSGLRYDVLGLVCGMDKSTAKRNQDVGLEILGKTLTHWTVCQKVTF